MNHVQSSSCESAGEEAQISEQHPGGRAGDRRLEVLGKTSTATEPSEAALDHPSSGQELEAFNTGRALDDFDGPRPAIGGGIEQLFAAINPVGEDMAQLREGSAQRAQQPN